MSAVLGQKYVRADGVEKVTGLGRYTADLNSPGSCTRSFGTPITPMPRSSGSTSRRHAPYPGVLAVLTHEDVPDVKYGGMVQDRRLFAKDKVLGRATSSPPWPPSRRRSRRAR